MSAVQLVTDEELAVIKEGAFARIACRDEHDWPALAAVLLLQRPI